MKLDLQRQLVRADVLAQPAEWRAEHLRPGGEGERRFFRDALGAEDADFLQAQAEQEQRLNRRETGTKDLLQRFGISAEGEEKALTEIAGTQESDPACKALYLGKLAAQRTQERRAVAQSAGNAYRLALEGCDGEIDPADRLRLHRAGQMDGILEAAQFARNANPKGDLLFKERYLAMAPEERAGYGVGELAKRLSAQDFLEVTQGAAGEEDQTQRARMEGFVQAVKPMLRSVTLGKYATPQEKERDEWLLALIHDETQLIVGDEEKKKGRLLTTSEHHEVIREAIDHALLLRATLDGYNIAALDQTDASASGPLVDRENTQRNDLALPERQDEPITLLAQGSNRGGSNRGGSNRGGGWGPFSDLTAPVREQLFRDNMNLIGRLEPNNRTLSYIRDFSIPISPESVAASRKELEAIYARWARQMSRGHGFKEHAREFAGDRVRFAEIAQGIMTRTPPHQAIPMQKGATAFYDRATNTLVIIRPHNPDRSTMMKPRGGQEYVDTKLQLEE